jgi:hypothetical protein
VHIGKSKSNAPFILTRRAATKSEALFKTAFLIGREGTDGSNPCTLQKRLLVSRHRRLAGRAGLPGV